MLAWYGVREGVSRDVYGVGATVATEQAGRCWRTNVNIVTWCRAGVNQVMWRPVATELYSSWSSRHAGRNVTM